MCIYASTPLVINPHNKNQGDHMYASRMFIIKFIQNEQHLEHTNGYMLKLSNINIQLWNTGVKNIVKNIVNNITMN